MCKAMIRRYLCLLVLVFHEILGLGSGDRRRATKIFFPALQFHTAVLSNLFKIGQIKLYVLKIEVSVDTETDAKMRTH